MLMQHDFDRDLEQSRAESQSDVVTAFYSRLMARYFASARLFRLRSATSVDDRRGIDRFLLWQHTATGKIDMITVQEKLRRQRFPDVALEYTHRFHVGHQNDGWIRKRPTAAVTAYIWLTHGDGIVFDSLALYNFWRLNERNLLARYPSIESPNREYVSINCVIPCEHLIETLGPWHAWPVEPDDYDADKDMSGSVLECYRAIRQRVANGGPGFDENRKP